MLQLPTILPLPGLLILTTWSALVRAVQWGRRVRSDPQVWDKPFDILRKLDRAGLPYYLTPFEMDEAGRKQTLYALGSAAGDGKRWAVPAMKLRAISASAEAREALADVTDLGDDPAG